jgi:hypothetical protein
MLLNKSRLCGLETRRGQCLRAEGKAKATFSEMHLTHRLRWESYVSKYFFCLSERAERARQIRRVQGSDPECTLPRR